MPTDARQVYDLPEGSVMSPKGLRPLLPQVVDLKEMEDIFGKSETCRVSEGQSPETGTRERGEVTSSV